MRRESSPEIYVQERQCCIPAYRRRKNLEVFKLFAIVALAQQQLPIKSHACNNILYMRACLSRMISFLERLSSLKTSKHAWILLYLIAFDLCGYIYLAVKQAYVAFCKGMLNTACGSCDLPLYSIKSVNVDLFVKCMWNGRSQIIILARLVVNGDWACKLSARERLNVQLKT